MSKTPTAKAWQQRKADFSESPEQLLEHAVPHVLRHRRQIEKFLLKFEASEN